MVYAKLFEPCRVGKLDLPNRIVMPPMTTHLGKGGFATEAMVAYYSERARGGAGLIMVEDADVDSPTGHHSHDPMLINDDKYLPNLHRLSQAIKAGGAKAGLNINHGGRRSGRLVDGKLLITQGKLPVAPSAIAHPVPGYVVPRELSLDEIEELENKFAQAARRVREAGFDVVCVHAAHMYLISQFLSPISNQRQDIYGRDLDGRLRFLLEIIRKVKEKVGRDYPLMVRINGEDPIEGGLTVEDAKEISHRLEAAGVNCVSVSAGAGPLFGRKSTTAVSPARQGLACLAHLAVTIKQRVSIPVMTTNRIVTPRLAEEILEAGKADLIGVGRGLLADPEWPKKAKEGREDDIRFCIGCMHCYGGAFATGSIRCAVNARAGHETERNIISAAKPKTVFIAGGGPAGLEAARVAAVRGHKVRLFEKEKVGGQLNLACAPPGKAEMKLFLDFEQSQLNQLGVRIESRELTPEVVKQGKPDAVIVACGARPVVPALPGIEASNVFTAWQVLKGDVVPQREVVILGGGQVGAETAEYLAERGHQVTIVEMLDVIATDMDTNTRQLLLFSLADLGVKILTRTTAKKVAERGILVEHRGKERLIKADSVVLALGAQPNRELANQLKKLEIELYAVGDCVEVRKLPNAVEEGFKAGLQV